MRRTVTVCCAAAVLCALVTLAPSAGAATRTALTITYFADGDRRDDWIRWTLRCAPAGGTHPRAAATCAAVARLGWRAFRPVPRNTACTDIFGGPQVAIVSGRVAGRRIWARLSRRDGCQIERWERVPSLLPAGGVR